MTGIVDASSTGRASGGALSDATCGRCPNPTISPGWCEQTLEKAHDCRCGRSNAAGFGDLTTVQYDGIIS